MVAGWVPGGGLGIYTVTPGEKTAQVESARKDSGYAYYNDYAIPSANGDAVYYDKGLYNSELQPSNPNPANSLPVYGTDSYFVVLAEQKVNGQNSDVPSVYSRSDRRLLVTLPPINDISVPDAYHIAFHAGDRELTRDQRFLFFSPANVVVSLPDVRDHLVLQRFDVMAALNKAGIDYLFVASLPPTTFAKGRRFVYQINAQSRRGGVGYKLESGPAGMTLSKTGRLEWPVPADYAGQGETVIVSLHDASGQEIYHTFQIKPE